MSKCESCELRQGGNGHQCGLVTCTKCGACFPPDLIVREDDQPYCWDCWFALPVCAGCGDLVDGSQFTSPVDGEMVCERCWRETMEEIAQEWESVRPERSREDLGL
jgi:hypothetical protein